MLKRLKNKKGFTLVELVVVMAVSVIICVAAVGLFTPAMGMINSLKSNVNMDTVCNTINEYVRNSVQCSTHVSVNTFRTTDVSHLETAVADAQTVTSGFDGYEVHAIAFIGNRAYDFGEVSSADIAAKIASPYNYRVFNEIFYAKTNYKMTFSDGGDGEGRWMNIVGQCFESDGSIANQERKSSFKLLDPRASIVTPRYEATDDCLIIIFNVYNP